MADQVYHEGRKKDSTVARPGPDPYIVVRDNGDGTYTVETALRRTKDGRLVTGQHPDASGRFADRGDFVFREELEFFGVLEPEEEE